MTFRIDWTPVLERVRVAKDRNVLVAWYRDIADSAYREFERQHRRPGRGRVYRRPGGRLHRASAPGDYAARDFGNLLSGTRHGANSNEGYVGTNVFYAKFLRDGTSKMRPRKLYNEAMHHAADMDGGRGLEGYLQWRA